MKRKALLKEFLGALGAEEIIFSSEGVNHISGTAIYDLNDPEERQKFFWHAAEDDAPRNEVINLVSLLNKEKLLSIDQIKISRSELLDKYNNDFMPQLSEEVFVSVLEELEAIEVRMIDEGRETDVFFIHE